MIPETRRLLHILRRGGGEGRLRALASWFGGFFDPRLRHYVWNWRDPLPWFRDLGNVVRKGLRRDTSGPGA